LDPAGWTHLVGADGTVHARVKSKAITRTIRHKTPDGQTRTTQVTEKVVAKWSADYAARDRLARAEITAKAAALAADPAKFKASNRRGVKKYVATTHADPRTGEVLDGVEVLSLDTARLQADALLDGYWVLHSSRVDATDAELLADYRQLWMIEDTFRVSKADLEGRPVHVWAPQHTEAHFATCFLALLAARTLERRTGLPTHRLQDAMRRLSVSRAAPGVHLVNRPAEWDAIDQALGVDTNRKWVTDPGLRQWRRQITAALTQPPPT
jgi:hypothetical protein